MNDVPDAAALAAVAAAPNCFAFNQKFPGGFTPNFGGDVSDSSITGGTRGELGNGLHYDLSASVGRSSVDFVISNTVNPNLAAQELNIPTKYDPGSYVQLERSFNLDLSYPVAISGLASDLNVAGGLEYREEIFEIKRGDANSFAIDPDLAAQGFGIGSNGFPGFKPEDAGEFDRDSYAAYLDLEADITDAFLLGLAVRYEDFSDFGSTTNGKVAARWQLADAFALRASASTGFRAPTVGQANVRNVTTAFTNGVLADEATLPPTNPISVQKGGKALEPEESVSLAVGGVVEVGNLSLTIDYFNVEVTDRIALTTTQPLTPADIAALLALGIADASSFTGVRFFTNDFDTTTEGIDVVASYPLDLFGGSTLLSAVFNWTQTTVDSFNPTIIGDTRVRQLEENLPEYRSSVTASHTQGPWNGFVRVNYYGDYYEAHLDDGTLPISPDAQVTIDTEIGFSFSESLSLVVGAQNLLDEVPDDNPWDFIAGAQYPVTSPMGFNGGFYYGRVVWAF